MQYSNLIGPGQNKKKAANLSTSTLNIKPSLNEKEEYKSQKDFMLLGHSGPVYGLSISLDDKNILSCSYDTTSNHLFIISLVRLWSL